MGYLASAAGAAIGSRLGAKYASQIGKTAGKNAASFVDIGEHAANTVRDLTDRGVPHQQSATSRMAGEVGSHLAANKGRYVAAAENLGTTYAPQIGAIVGAHLANRVATGTGRAASRVGHFVAGQADANQQVTTNPYGMY